MADQVLQLPPSLLNEIPAASPPPGQQSNLINPVDKGYVLVVTASVFLALGLVAFFIRGYAKLFIIRKLTWDDLTLTCGMLGIIITYIGNVIGCTAGPCGKHQWDTSVGQEITKLSIISNYLDTAFLTPALGFLKLSVLLMYFNIFWPMRWLRIQVYIASFIIVGFYIAITIYIFVYDTPRPGVPWREWVIRPDGTKTLEVSIPTGAFGLATDTYLLLLPIPAVLRLQMAGRKKLGVLSVFATGFLAVVASAVGTYYRVVQYRTQDFNWNTVPIETFVQVEMNAGVLCVSMPAIAKVFNHHLPFFSSIVSTVSSRINLLRSRKSHTRLDESGTRAEQPGTDQYMELQKLKGAQIHQGKASSDTNGHADDTVSHERLRAVQGTNWV